MEKKELNILCAQRIILFGMKHSGKSTIGRKLAEKLGWFFRDLDDCIEFETQKVSGISIRDFFKSEERHRFFEIESNCLNRFIHKHQAPWILATGGGIIENKKALTSLPKKAVKIFLDHKPEILFSRIIENGLPPFLSPKEPYKSFLEIYKSRSERYRLCADLIVDLDDSTIDQTTDKLFSSLKEYLNAW